MWFPKPPCCRESRKTRLPKDEARFFSVHSQSGMNGAAVLALLYQHLDPPLRCETHTAESTLAGERLRQRGQPPPGLRWSPRWAWRSAGGHGCLCRCSSAPGCETWPTPAALVFTSLRALQNPPPPKQNSAVSARGRSCGLSPPAAPHPPGEGQQAEGHSQRLFALMCGPTADITAAKLRATSDLCGEPPVSSYSVPPPTAAGAPAPPTPTSCLLEAPRLERLLVQSQTCPGESP